MDNFTIVWSFRNRLEILKNSISSADKTCPKNVDFCLIDAASTMDTIINLRKFCNEITDRTIKTCESTYRSSLSEAWNLGMMLTSNRYVIFASSDVIFLKPDWFNLIHACMVNHQKEYLLLENHAVFCIDKKCIPRLGWFDESFGIGPHFDVDYMIRASENNIKFGILHNRDYYVHEGEQKNEMKDRLAKDIENRLPMNNIENEIIFKKKWQSSWPGWSNYEDNPPHPPTHITQVKRLISEIDAHPLYTEKLKNK